MFSVLRNRCGQRASGTVGRMVTGQTRSLATVQTVQTTPAGRSPPLMRPKGTPVSRERATLTIKVFGDVLEDGESTDHIRMVLFSMESRLVQRQTSLERLSSLLHLCVFLN
jgi:hypothetical protein